jgi:hypothetical protein
MPDEIQSGRYVLLQPLGEGGQGVTFDGVDKREGRPVAIKRFDVRGAKTWKDVELAEREARVLQSLSHPKLPAYVDHFEEGGALYLVMEKIDGESVAAQRRAGQVFREQDVVRLLRDAADVLDYLHGRSPPVIHRDLKPGNVIRRPDGSYAFVDFGSVRDRLRPKGGSTVVGTFGYMAPEQMQGRALPASDVYAVGATAITMLTGSEPEDLPHRGLGIDVRRALRGTSTSEATIAALERMLDPDPDRRASRLAPLLAAGERQRRPAASARRQPRPEDWIAEQVARKVERQVRHATRRAEHAARRAARHASRYQRFGDDRRPPLFVRVLFRLMLVVGMIAVAVATRVIVPLVLLFLSLFVARRSLVRAAGAVRRGGQVALRTMSAASRKWVAGGAGPESASAWWTADAGGEGGEVSERVRVDGATETRARVDPAASGADRRGGYDGPDGNAASAEPASDDGEDDEDMPSRSRHSHRA